MSAGSTAAPAGARVTKEGCAAALAGLRRMWPQRLRALLDAWPPHEAWRRATSGELALLAERPEVAASLGERAEEQAEIVASWAGARTVDPAAVLAAHDAAGAAVLLRGARGYPPSLADDIEAPAVLFAHGSVAALDGPRVAIVGTRRCTGPGAGFAHELGHDLAEAGVAVLSGLALGIDGAAHRGALEARASGGAAPVGVVGSGLDVVYPARHRQLWASVAAQGYLLGEAPLGARPVGWRFPARNRIIAALADVVVVVESHAAGGSLLTVTEAQRRDVPVLAAPGSVRNPAAAGTNQLIADGCHPVCDADDVLVALGLSSGRREARRDRRPAPDASGRAVLDALGWEAATLEHLAMRTSLPLPRLTLALEALQAAGWVQLEGGWYERVSPP